MFQGFLTINGVEVINTARTYDYGRDARWLLPTSYVCPDLAAGLGVPYGYGSPLADSGGDADVNAPWFDPDNLDTGDFWGLLPTGINGFEDSSFTSTITEFAGDGGTVTNSRRASQELVVTGVMIGRSNAGIDAGMAWLRSVLDGGCDTCDGSDICYLAACPDIDTTLDDPTGCLDPYWRIRRGCSTTSPLQKTGELPISDEGLILLQVTFTLTSTVPYEYGIETLVNGGIFSSIAQALPGVTPNPSVQIDVPCGDMGSPDVAAAQLSLYDAQDALTAAQIALKASPTNTVAQQNYNAALAAVVAATNILNAAILANSYLTDPTLPLIAPPPASPPIFSDLIFPRRWTRWAVEMPAEDIPAAIESVPKMTIVVGYTDIRMLRFRFYADPVGLFAVDGLDPCAFCGEFTITYLPKGTILTIDGSDESIMLAVPGGTQIDSSSNVYGSNGEAFTWPALTCGYAYVMTIDVQNGYPAPQEIALSVFNRS